MIRLRFSLRLVENMDFYAIYSLSTSDYIYWDSLHVIPPSEPHLMEASWFNLSLAKDTMSLRAIYLGSLELGNREEYPKVHLYDSAHDMTDFAREKGHEVDRQKALLNLLEALSCSGVFNNDECSNEAGTITKERAFARWTEFLYNV